MGIQYLKGMLLDVILQLVINKIRYLNVYLNKMTT